ncbi:hypothetical protein Zmor_015026 [Zophobas morio]|uniref:Ubiquinone biosynthesis O-methyltransferase, mitochondrial n=1 Tax=Zophobas morio TaxID=2755281 RepID=A0AA38ILQ9_9CUCU|nr:hypothetical protein Zmor_015026 [Zophobas morio]
MFVKSRFFFRTYTSKRIKTDEKELKNFTALAKEWWDPNGSLRGLQTFNKCRIPWIKNRLIAVGVIKPDVDETCCFQELSFLEVGCGGGILSEDLSRLGCQVTGLDANETLINIAKNHAHLSQLTNLSYVHGTIQDYATQNRERYDVVVSSETIEHVSEKEEFVKFCVQCLKPGGSIFMTTPNKTWLSRFFWTFIMEDCFRILPKGTHSYDMFIHYNDLKQLMSSENCDTVFIGGLLHSPVTLNWYLVKNKSISYAIHAVKRS